VFLLVVNSLSKHTWLPYFSLSKSSALLEAEGMMIFEMRTTITSRISFPDTQFNHAPCFYLSVLYSHGRTSVVEYALVSYYIQHSFY
jgi:hypothetical protein